MAHETPTVVAEPRERIGTRYSRRLRNAGRLPAVIYGHKRDPVHIHIDAKEILIHVGQGMHLVEVKIEGASETCIVKDLQFGYLGDNVVHVDFARVDLDEEVRVNVSLRFVGEAPAAQKTGAVLSHDLTDLEIICRANAIPDEIRVDLSLMEEETALTLDSIELPPGVRTETDRGTSVAHISYIHEEEAVGEEVEVVPGEGEPEVITEAKPEDTPEKEKTP